MFLTFSSTGLWPWSEFFYHLKMLNVESTVWTFTISSKRRTCPNTLKLQTSMLLCKHLHVSLTFSTTGFIFLQMNFLPQENHVRQGALLWKANTVSKGNIVKEPLITQFDYILQVDTCVSSIQPCRSVYCNVNDSPTWKQTGTGNLLKLKWSSYRETFTHRLKLLTCMLCFKHSLGSDPMDIYTSFPYSEYFCHLKTQTEREHSFDSRSQFSQEGNV
jgi:hypothetical protein